MNCPQCGKPAEAEHVDIGVGLQRVEPWHCKPCGWIEPGFDILDFPGELDFLEYEEDGK